LKRILLASTEEGSLVLDPFCGSSTTGVACALSGRRYVGIESEGRYLELSKKRLEEVKQKIQI
jgi:site-specific DNA-methyltransferase (adenine-specific)